MVHFLHRRSARADATPLILTHGWPGSIAEFVDVVDELADPKDANAPAFRVVAPRAAGLRPQRQADRHQVGNRKDRDRMGRTDGKARCGEFVAHRGDWGGNITTVLGGRFPPQVLGIHSTFAEAPPGSQTDGLTALERRWTEGNPRFLAPPRGACEVAGDPAADHRLLARRLIGRAFRLDPGQVRLGDHHGPPRHREVPALLGAGAARGGLRRLAHRTPRGRPMQITPEAIQDFRIGDLSAGAVDADETAPDTSTGRPGHLPCEQLWIQRIIYGLGHYQGLFAAEAAGSREDKVAISI
ncbi:epoxide hydrolase N-terminal domain-containing protein [Actinomadura nitritigenes]|uniref:epoxide hydrolase N-terminal domain-containing protein n=1 Tax=Actinomadura nitritigenes TaxID=134602 RepID=UPI0036B1E579